MESGGLILRINYKAVANFGRPAPGRSLNFGDVVIRRWALYFHVRPSDLVRVDLLVKVDRLV